MYINAIYENARQAKSHIVAALITRKRDDMGEDILPKAKLSMLKRTMQIGFGIHHIVGEPKGLEPADILTLSRGARV